MPSTVIGHRHLPANGEGDDVSIVLGQDVQLRDDEEVFDLGYAGFQVGDHLATGGQGVVVSAMDEMFQREVALKVLSSHLSNEPRYGQRFLKEASLTANLQHPGIVPVYAAGLASDGRPFFSMRRVEGETLDEALQRRAAPSEDLPQFLRVFLKICQTVAYCHDHGVIHCDLKPSNIMLGRYGEVLVMDFGLAARASSLAREQVSAKPSVPEIVPVPMSTDPTASRTVWGTPEYMSPEQALGQIGKLSQRTDVFGLGMILYEILVGEKFYEGETPAALLKKAGEASHVAQTRKLSAADCDPKLAAICLECINADPQQRPQNGGVVVEKITEFLDASMCHAESDIEHFFKLSPDLFCIANLSGYFLRVNPNFSRVLGYDEAELLAVPFLERLHPDDVQKTVEEIKRLTEGKPVSRFLNRFQTSSGEYRWFEWTAKSLPEEGLIFAAARDITSNLEDRLFSQILHVTPQALVVIDTCGKIVLVNECTEELFGCDEGDLLGQPFNQRLPEAVWDSYLQLRNMEPKSPKRAKRPSTMCTISTTDGQERPVQIDVTSLKTDIGEFAVAWIQPRSRSQ